MIKNLIFDLGNVFVDLNLQSIEEKWFEHKNETERIEITKICEELEQGKIDESIFLGQLQNYYPNQTTKDIKSEWNSMLVSLPQYRIDFLKTLVGKYQMVLLSNTNAIHIDYLEGQFKRQFKELSNCFDKLYLSHVLQLSKPNPEIFKKVIQDTGWNPNETLFIDDTLIHVEGAQSIGIYGWHLIIGQQDVIELFNVNKELLR